MKPVMLIPPNVVGLPQLAAQMGIKSAVTKLRRNCRGCCHLTTLIPLKKFGKISAIAA